MQGRMRMTPSLRKELWRTPDLLGFAAHWTWIWCVFWSSLFYAEGTLLNSSGSAGAAAGLSTIALERSPLRSPRWARWPSPIRRS